MVSTQKIENVLNYMKKKHVPLKDVLSYILDDPSPRCVAYRRWVFEDLESMLDQIDEYKEGRQILKRWSREFTCKVVDREMQKVQKAFTMTTDGITPEFVETWSFSRLQETIERSAPTLCAILLAGVQTARAKKERKRDPMVVRGSPGHRLSG